FTTTELIDMLTNQAKQKNYYNIGLGRRGNKNIPVQNQKPRNKYGYSIEKSGNDFVFYGRGWGHGVGLCQYGAMAMAEQGYKAEDILAHYYPGTIVRKIKL
ncbi:MAG: stage II sporulation protein SpoIID, partial [Synergistaceae bacterium]|nr:stage II sporulation protein SpoIID [Synergistaceae bacterium]